MGLFSGLGKILGAAVAGALIATGVGAFAGLVATGGAFAGFGAGTFSAYFARQFAINAVLGFLSNALAPKPSDQTSASDLLGQNVAQRTPLGSRKIAYGTVRTAGTIVFMEATGTNNKYLHQVVTLAGHEINAVNSVYLNDTLCASSLTDSIEVNSGTTSEPDYANYVKFTTHFGSPTQLADTNLVSRTSWTTEHKLSEIAYIYTQLEYNQDTFTSGVPNVSAVIEGKKVYDPRTLTTYFTDNAALCLLDYLRDDKYGLGCSDDEIDFTSFATAADVCDEAVTLDAGGTEKRYTINGLIDTAKAPNGILQDMAAAMAGTVYYSNGQWKCRAGEYITPTDTLTVDDFIGDISVNTRVTNQSNFNAVKGIFVSPADNWQPVDYPAVTSTAFENEDNNERRFLDLTLPFTTSAATAQRLAKIALYRNREQITVSVTCKLSAYKYEIGDTLMITHAQYGWSSKVFEVIGWQLTLENGQPAVLLTLKETSATVYSWTAATDESALTRNNTTLPSPFQIAAPTNLTLAQVQSIVDDGAFQSQILVTWDAAADAYVDYYEVQWKRGDSSEDYGLIVNAAGVNLDHGLVTGTVTNTDDYGLITETPSTADTYFNSIFTRDRQFLINNVTTEDYTIRVRSVNQFGVRSAWVSDVVSPLADTVAPSIPESLVATGAFRQVFLTWANPPDNDLDLINVYRNTTNNSAGSVYIGSTRGTSYLDSGLGINTTYYYWLKAQDRTGNDSGFSAVGSATTAFVDSADFSAEVLNLFAEAGAYGIEPVANLPATGDFDGQIKYDTTANKLYRWDATGAAWSDDIFSITAGSVDLASFASGIEPVSIVATLPNPVGYTGAQVVFLTTDYKLYRYDSVTPAWTSSTAATDISGTISATNFPSDLRPIEIVASLPITDLYDGRQVYLTTDKKLYRYNGTAWITSIASSDITGTLTDAQLQSIQAAKLTGTITTTQITDDAITTAKLAAGSVTASEIAASAITSDKIAANAITTGKLAAGAVTANEIAANTITAGQIATGAIAADEIAASAITSDKLAANSVTAGAIAAGAISADAIAAGVITGDKIAASTIQGDKIAANTITGGLIAASGGIKSAAQIDNGVITNAKIENGAITTAKIGDLQVSTLKIADNAITIPLWVGTRVSYTLPQDGNWHVILTLATTIPQGITETFKVIGTI